MFEVRGLEKVQHTLQIERVMRLYALPQRPPHNRHGWPHSNHELVVTTESTNPRVLVDLLLKSARLKSHPEISLKSLPEHQHESLREKEFPHYGDDLIIGFEMGVRITARDNLSVLRNGSGKKIGFWDSEQVHTVLEKMPRVYLFGVEQNSATMARKIRESRIMYEALMLQSRITKKRKEALEAKAEEGDYTYVTFANLGAGEAEVGPSINARQVITKEQLDEGVLQLLPTRFVPKPYSLVSLMPDMTRTLRITQP